MDCTAVHCRRAVQGGACVAGSSSPVRCCAAARRIADPSVNWIIVEQSRYTGLDPGPWARQAPGPCWPGREPQLSAVPRAPACPSCSAATKNVIVEVHKDVASRLLMHFLYFGLPSCSIVVPCVCLWSRDLRVLRPLRHVAPTSARVCGARKTLLWDERGFWGASAWFRGGLAPQLLGLLRLLRRCGQCRPRRKENIFESRQGI